MNEEQKQLNGLQKIDARIKRWRERKRRMAGKNKRADRKKETRKKILIGTMILAKADRDLKTAEWLRSKLSEFLSSESDRALFGLQKAQAPTASPAPNEVTPAVGHAQFIPNKGAV